MIIESFIIQSYEIAKSKMFSYDNRERIFLGFISEIMEVFEEYRKTNNTGESFWLEVADCYVRIFSYFGYLKASNYPLWNNMKEFENTEFKFLPHSQIFSSVEHFCIRFLDVANRMFSKSCSIARCLSLIDCLQGFSFQHNMIKDIENLILKKMEYNKQRPILHGKAF